MKLLCTSVSSDSVKTETTGSSAHSYRRSTVCLGVLCFLLVSVSCVFSVRVCDPCPQDWKEHNGQCYYFSTSVTTWNESQNNCSKEAAHLVTVNSEEEQVTGLISVCDCLCE
uniref:C-type lectin domain-containing protein n=1 Tax=Paramormyrops kingsleyae TaxID=1676925 RepID=A0A3B3SKE2_9TELE